jgi:hypothetical protein
MDGGHVTGVQVPALTMAFGLEKTLGKSYKPRIPPTGSFRTCWGLPMGRNRQAAKTGLFEPFFYRLVEEKL